MTQSYESYRAEMAAQLLAPLSREAWDREVALSKPHTVDFTVTQEMAQRGSLAVGVYRNHFGNDQRLIKTERVVS